MIAAPNSILLPRSTALLALSLALTAGCQGDAAGDRPRQASAAASRERARSASEGDIVIATPPTPYRVAAVAAPGSVTGAVTLKNPLEVLPPAETGRESAICGPSIPDLSVQLQGGGVVGAVVWLDGVRTGKALGLERRVELESDHCKLTPRIQAAVVGSAVNIIGHDDFRQHLRFMAAGDSVPRAMILLGGGEQVIPTELPFKKSGLVSVRDAGRAWTRAYLAVFDHPYFTVTGPGGSFTIDGVPSGNYTLNVWHERTGVVRQPVEVAPNGAAKVAVVLNSP